MMDREDAIEYLERKGEIGEHIKKTKMEIPLYENRDFLISN